MTLGSKDGTRKGYESRLHAESSHLQRWAIGDGHRLDFVKASSWKSSKIVFQMHSKELVALEVSLYLVPTSSSAKLYGIYPDS